MKIIIVGAGKVGFILAYMLSKENHEVTVVDIKESRIATIEERLDVKTICGSGVSKAVLKEAGAEDADILAAVTERDELNIVACFIAKSFGVDITIARVRSPEFVDLDEETTKRELGIDLIINPERIAANQISKMINNPEALNVEYYDNKNVQMLELKVTENAQTVNCRLLDVDHRYPFLVVGIIRDGKMNIPGGQDCIQAGDLIFLLAASKNIASIEQLFGHKQRKVKNIIIVGGDTISYYLAGQLETNKDLNIKIFERDLERCKELSNQLKRTLIIHGDATDIQLLKDENVEDSDLFIAADEDDKYNVLSATLAKQLGATKTITQLRMSDYIPLVEKIGIDQNISPRLLAAGAILKYVHHSNILSITLIGDAVAHVLEMIVSADAKHTNIPLQKLHFPKGGIIGAIVRNEEVIIPRGGDVVLPGDRLIVFALPDATREVENYFG